MVTDMFWSAAPRARRTLADLAIILHDNDSGERIALLLGAGIDLQLTGRPLWKEFVVEVASNSEMPAGENDAIKMVANAFPVETAEALRIAVGRKAFYRALREAAGFQPLTSNGGSMAAVLQELVSNGIRIIVTFNYSRDVAQAISSRNDAELLLVQRIHLSGWPKLDLLHPENDKIHLIAIHGMVDETQESLSTAVLDRSSYDSVVFSDYHYSEFLQRIFTDHTVLSVGLSWEDVVLRNAAARVHHAAPLSPKSHAALLPSGDDRGTEISHKADLWKERSFVGAYSVRPVYYDPADNHAELKIVLKSVNELVTLFQTNTPSREDFKEKLPSSATSRKFQRYADLLDECGDYESVFQRRWFAQAWQTLKDALATCDSEMINDQDQWLALARVERHLRHFLWVYVRPSARGEAREQCWHAVATVGMNLHRAGKLSYWSDETLANATGHSRSPTGRGLFEFAIGAYEIYSDGEPPDEVVQYWRKLLMGAKPENIQARVAIAKELWRVIEPSPTRLVRLSELRADAISCGWEAIEAKLALDICEWNFRIARPASGSPLRHLPDQQRKDLLHYALDAREAARVAGCARRELGAVALASLVEDHERAEADLVGIFHGMVKTVAGGAGPIATWGIYAGLLASLLDRVKDEATVAPEEAAKWIEERCGSLRSPQHDDLPAVLTEYWNDFHPRTATLVAETATLVAERET